MGVNFDAGEYRVYINSDYTDPYAEPQESSSNIYRFTSTHAPNPKTTWVPKTWRGMPSAKGGLYGDDIWFWGTDFFYSWNEYQGISPISYGTYKFNKELNRWQEYNWRAWSSAIIGKDIWHDKRGNFFCDLYYLTEDPDYPGRYRWNDVTPRWSGFSSGIDGRYVFYDNNNNCYYIPYVSASSSPSVYTLTQVWNPSASSHYWSSTQNFTRWNNNTYIYGLNVSDIWKDGKEIYCSNSSRNIQGKALWNSSRSRYEWQQVVWEGDLIPDGKYIWTDGYYIYHSDGLGNNYILDKSTNTWLPKTWNGYSNIDGQYIWSDRENVYYSKGSEQYVLT